MLGRDIKKAVKRTKRAIGNIDWNKTTHNASSIAGTVGGAVALARLVTRKNSSKKRLNKISNTLKVSAASLALVAGGIKLLNDNMPDQASKITDTYKSVARRYRKKLSI